MKKTLLFLILITISTVDCYCQLAILDNSRDKRWFIVITTNLWPPESIHRYRTTVIKLGDVVLKNAITYTSLLSTKDSDFLSWDTIGYMREINQQVFYKPFSQDSDFMMYDFNLSLSSRVNLVEPMSSYPYDITHTYTVNRVDSIIIGGEKRKRISLGNKEVWIEGIGSLYGLIYCGLAIDGSRWELSCYSENGKVIYHNPIYATCFCTTDLEILNERSNILFSNNEIVYIRERKNATFQLFDLSGIQIMERVLDNDNCIINVELFSSGVYLYRVFDKNSNLVGKLIVD